MAKARPQTRNALGQLAGIGEAKVEKFADERGPGRFQFLRAESTFVQRPGFQPRYLEAKKILRPEGTRVNWQAGYGWFSVGPRGLEAACDYVHSQKAHHQRESFQDEFRKFLRQYGVGFDERYVWD